MPLTVRYRNGAPSNSTLSDSAGNGILVELFPLFNWYVAEADTTRFKQTGVSIWVDGGGKVDATGIGQFLWSSTYPTGESSFRTEQPGALSYGVQSFISQRNRVDWGRTPYARNENGGIYGNVVYSSTRPFDDQRFNVQTIWEPLVPRVTVNLYEMRTLPDGSETLSLVDSTKTSSWDDWVNRVYGANGNQYLLGPDRSCATRTPGRWRQPGRTRRASRSTCSARDSSPAIRSSTTRSARTTASAATTASTTGTRCRPRRTTVATVPQRRLRRGAPADRRAEGRGPDAGQPAPGHVRGRGGDAAGLRDRQGGGQEHPHR